MGVILRRKVATYNGQMSKLPRVSLFQIYSAVCLPNIIWIDLQLRNLSQFTKIKRVNFLLRHSVELVNSKF